MGLDYWGGGQTAAPEFSGWAVVREGTGEYPSAAAAVAAASAGSTSAAPVDEVAASGRVTASPRSTVSALDEIRRKLAAGESVAASDLEAARRAVQRRR
jgi:hypothetical protein